MDLDLIIDTNEPVDMKAGLETMLGVSDAVTRVATCLIEDRLPAKLTTKRKTHTTLKQRFKGSYGQAFKIEVNDERLRQKMNSIGEETFFEVLSYYLWDSVFVQKRTLSKKAKKIVSHIEKNYDLAEQLRTSTMRNIHSVVRGYGYDLLVRGVFNSGDREVLVKFDENTLETTELIENDEEISFQAAVTRLNINTGNGRLLVLDGDETIAFGFSNKYKIIDNIIKKKVSDNLSFNNLRDDGNWEYLYFTARRLLRRDGLVAKYILTSVSGQEVSM